MVEKKVDPLGDTNTSVTIPMRDVPVGHVFVFPNDTCQWIRLEMDEHLAHRIPEHYVLYRAVFSSRNEIRAQHCNYQVCLWLREDSNG